MFDTMLPVIFICFILVILLVILLVLFGIRIRQKKVLASLFYGGQCSLIFCLLLIGLLLLSNLYLYNRLTFERPIAVVELVKKERQEFTLVFYGVEDGQEHFSEQFLIEGDEWQIDARIIKWHNWANLIGMNSLYHLDRVSGRFRNIEQANQNKHTAYSLFEHSRGLDVWKLKSVFSEHLPFMDAYYGQSIYLPMADKAKFEVSILQTGLIARPINDEARAVLSGW
ncbi:MAG: hypothetical protein ACI845_001251 [Gammaproteobacteria bacterium]|jgi:hypothetical protein